MFLNLKKENEMSLFVYSKKTVFYMFQKIDALPVEKSRQKFTDANSICPSRKQTRNFLFCTVRAPPANNGKQIDLCSSKTRKY